MTKKCSKVFRVQTKSSRARPKAAKLFFRIPFYKYHALRTSPFVPGFFITNVEYVHDGIVIYFQLSKKQISSDNYPPLG